MSSNIVGYEKLNLKAGSFVMGATQFQLVGGGSGTLSDLFSANDIPYNTEIRVVNESGSYDIYKYLDEAYNPVTDDVEEGWADGFAELVKDPFDPGTGFWVKAPENYELTEAGEVPSEATITLTLTPGMFQMISDPYPEAFNPNKVTWENLEYNTEIRVPNASGSYDIYKYLDEAYNAQTDDVEEGWADGFAELVLTPIADIKQGFWIRSTAETPVKITFTNPTTASAGE